MEVTLIALAIVVVAVAIDAIGRLDERRQQHEPVEASPITSEKIVVDLTGRDRD